MKSSKKNLISRGFINTTDFKIKSYDPVILSTQLHSQIPIERTDAALTIKQLNLLELLPDLINVLISEKKLYCKIALSESLIHFKPESIHPLLPLLGTIGTNQHKTLPTKAFKKNSYPLPRDIVARILSKMGNEVIPEIIQNINTFEVFQLAEAIDVLGYISFYSQDNSALPILKNLYKSYDNNELIRWKIIRSFSAFRDEEVLALLQNCIASDSSQPHKIEAERSYSIITK